MHSNCHLFLLHAHNVCPRRWKTSAIGFSFYCISRAFILCRNGHLQNLPSLPCCSKLCICPDHNGRTSIALIEISSLLICILLSHVSIRAAHTCSVVVVIHSAISFWSNCPSIHTAHAKEFNWFSYSLILFAYAQHVGVSF